MSKFNHKAVYWPPGTTSGTGGQLRFGDPVEIDCFWEGNTGQMPVQVQKRDGTLWTPKSIVSTPYSVQELGYLWHGEFRNLTDRDDPRKNLDVAKIESVAVYTDVQNTETLYMGYV